MTILYKRSLKRSRFEPNQTTSSYSFCGWLFSLQLAPDTFSVGALLLLLALGLNDLFFLACNV